MEAGVRGQYKHHVASHAMEEYNWETAPVASQPLAMAVTTVQVLVKNLLPVTTSPVQVNKKFEIQKIKIYTVELSLL